MDKFEQIADGEALEDLRAQPGFYALLRILKKKRDDLFTDWASEKDMSKDYCKGALYILETFEADVIQTIEYGKLLKQQEEESMQLARGRALDGGGTGDLTT